jgi:UDP-N-acetyl-D-glucosamine 4,6-dehydratase
MKFDKKILNFLVIIIVTLATFWWTSFIFHIDMAWDVVGVIIALRVITSIFYKSDHSLSWSKATQKTFLIKTVAVGFPMLISIGIYYQDVRIAFLLSEASFYLVATAFLMYSYQYYMNKSGIEKTKSLVIYGAGKAGMKLEDEFRHTEYKVDYFVDDDRIRQGRSIDGIKVISKSKLKESIGENKLDLLVIAIPSAPKERIKEIHEKLSPYFKSIKILPTIQEILRDKNFSAQLKDISVEDLLARHPKDLDKKAIENFISGKKVLITGAGGSIGSEIARQCSAFGADELILLDHSEFNLYQIAEELCEIKPHLVMQSVSNLELLDKTFEKYKPDIVIHAAAYKHVPLVEDNIGEAIINNVIGTKNTIDCAIKHDVKKFVLISTDKAVRPTNVMGTTKRICELYAQNINTPDNTEIVAVRFGNVLGSSGSVIPKFKAQIEAGKNITVTHPDITRYFMLIPEACELVLQAASIGKGGEIFILDMGESIKIVDLAKKMIELSGQDIKIEFSGLRPGEKLYEELLINNSDAKTEYESITVAGRTNYEIEKLQKDIEELIKTDKKLEKLKEIVPEFDHKVN